MPVLSRRLRKKIQAYLPKYPRKQAVTLPALHLVHDELRTVSNEAIVEIAEMLDLHPAEVHDTMTFYGFFGRGREARQDAAVGLPRPGVHAPRGDELIEHCEAEARRAVRRDDARTAKITLEFAECIGACDGAPACLRNDEHVMNVTPEKAGRS